VIPGVRDEIGRQIGEPGGTPRERRDPSRHHHSGSAHPLAVVQQQRETLTLTLDPHHEARIKVVCDPLLDPVAVVDERRERDRLTWRLSGLLCVTLDRQWALVLHDARGGAVGAQQHPHGHRAPERHRSTEDADLDSRATQVGRRGQAVGSGAHDCDGFRGHGTTFLLESPASNSRPTLAMKGRHAPE
jgi:hypothetical protein